MPSVKVAALDLAEKVLHVCILLIIHHCVPPSDYNWWVVMISLTAVGYGVDRAISVGSLKKGAVVLTRARLSTLVSSIVMLSTYTKCCWTTVV
jgi:hypothetical protein